MNNLEQLLSLKSAAERLGVCVRTVYRLIDDGELPKPVKIRGCSRLPVSSLNTYLQKLGVVVQAP